jgi:hypothetical protein
MIENNGLVRNSLTLEATDEMVAAAVLFVQDQCEIQGEAAASNIARGVWDRMIHSAPEGYFGRLLHPVADH